LKQEPPLAPRRSYDMDKPAMYAGRKDTTQKNVQTRRSPPSHPGADWVTKASTMPNHASGRTADLGRCKRSTYPGADRVTKARTALSPGNTQTDHFPRLRLLYPGANRVTKAMDPTMAHGTQTTDITTNTRHYSNGQRIHHPGADRVTKAMEVITAHGKQFTEHKGTTYPQHLRATGLIHGPPHQFYPRVH
jgi:hypothetical protein